jgi:hypothetical protein
MIYFRDHTVLLKRFLEILFAKNIYFDYTIKCYRKTYVEKVGFWIQYCIVQNEGISKLNIKNVYIMKVLKETKQKVF